MKAWLAHPHAALVNKQLQTVQEITNKCNEINAAYTSAQSMPAQ